MNRSEFVAKATGDRPTFFRRAIVFAGSFDPPAPHHVQLAEELVHVVDEMRQADDRIPVELIIWPVGPYDTKTQVAPPEARKEMVAAAFAGLDLRIETYDLDHTLTRGTTTYEMQTMLSHKSHTEMRERYFTPLAVPSITTEVWHVLGADNVDAIKKWDYGHELWKWGRFLVLARPGYAPKEMPPQAELLDFGVSGSCTDIRTAIKHGAWEHLLSPPVANLIKKHGLYEYQPNRGVAA